MSMGFLLIKSKTKYFRLQFLGTDDGIVRRNINYHYQLIQTYCLTHIQHEYTYVRIFMPYALFYPRNGQRT